VQLGICWRQGVRNSFWIFRVPVGSEFSVRWGAPWGVQPDARGAAERCADPSPSALDGGARAACPGVFRADARLICLTPRGPLINCLRGKRDLITVGCAFSGPSVPPAAEFTHPPAPSPAKPVSCEQREPIDMGVEAKSLLNISSAVGARSGARARVRVTRWMGTPDGYSAHFGRVQSRSNRRSTAQMRCSEDCGMPFAVVLSRNASHSWVGAANQEAA